ncbi:hypothetical protein HYR54_07065 [Candidatus Acetothermia bacterium]|nr:hypothetical protein [Candidatus Acetothermia bacterium]MBI3461410.1 hypothetical protein [Candidatus Acetothermia bacterium]MBI3660384.1 hypothetical protein [Candidatus Acetothermia bacterium]
MFEHYSEPLIPRKEYFRRLVKNALIASCTIAIAFMIGILGYHYFEGLAWIDAALNAAMILGGMGPVNGLHSTAGKLFATGYALFSGLIFITSVGIIAAPIVHRFLHQFHLEADEES